MAAKPKYLTERQKQNRSLLVGILFLAIFAGVFFIGYQYRPPAGDDTYRDMKELLKKEPASSYELNVKPTDSPILVIAPHGGKIEPFTSAIASGIARDEFSYFEFKGLLQRGAYTTLHVSSVNYNPDELTDLNRAAEVTVAVHGISGSDKLTYVGGRDEVGAQILRRHLEEAGFPVESAPANYTGMDAKNFVNRNARGQGIQLEITLSQRRALFTKRREDEPNEKYDRYTQAVANALREIQAGITE